MAKGSTGTETNVIIHMKRPKSIKCNCERCRHFQRKGTIRYCRYYDIFSPERTSCARYWCVKPDPEKRKKKSKNKKMNKA